MPPLAFPPPCAGASGIDAGERPLRTVGLGISPRRAISLIHSLGVIAPSKTPASRALGLNGGAKPTWMWL